ncbi:hypothetical protein [Pseudoflavonifractor capillosus]|nr:hypothetical protein [Pseudoflavonifractor capillosus]
MRRKRAKERDRTAENREKQERSGKELEKRRIAAPKNAACLAE